MLIGVAVQQHNSGHVADTVTLVVLESTLNWKFTETQHI